MYSRPSASQTARPRPARRRAAAWRRRARRSAPAPREPGRQLFPLAGTLQRLCGPRGPRAMTTEEEKAMTETLPTELEVLDERFPSCRGDRRVERLDPGCRWAEGPVYVPAGRYLVWSDIPNDRMMRWDETTGAVGVFRQPAGYTNGNTLDAAGPPRHLRARRPPGHPHGARRLDHRARRQLRGQAAQQPERRRRPLGRLDLVHRPRLRDRQRLRGPPGRERDRRLPRLPHRPGDAGELPRSWPTISCGRTAWPSRSTRSQLYIADTERQPHPGVRGRRRTARCPAARSSPAALLASSTGCAWTTPAASGPPPATASTASTPTAP